MAFQEGNVLDLDELSIEPGSRGRQHKTGELSAHQHTDGEDG
jgi:hypothetical protein